MPDKSKRRKNKNKRKNRNNRPETNKNNSDVNESVNTDVCSEHDNESIPDLQLIDETSTTTNPLAITTTENVTSPSINESIAMYSTNDILNDVCLNQDLNNNTNDNELETAETLDTKVENPENVLSVHKDDVEYIVESPEQSLRVNKTKLSDIKSKSLDDDDVPKITELVDDGNIQSEDGNSLTIIDGNKIVVSDVESDVEWEKTAAFPENLRPQWKELVTGTLSIAAIPLNVAHSNQTKTLTPEEEISLKNYLKTLNLSTNPSSNESIEIRTEIEHIINREIRHRLRKKDHAEDFLCTRPPPPRILDVIDEEGSNESSIASRRHSHLSDKKSDAEDLVDDVFEDSKKTCEKYSSKMVKNVPSFSQNITKRQVPQKCVLVGAKLKEPDITEARGAWSIQTVETMTGAEVVYLTDSSSSTSSIHTIGEDTDEESEDTDISVRMITPTIEITDTESLLNKSFVNLTKEQPKNTDTSKTLPKTEMQGNNGNNTPENSTYKDSYIENDHEIVILTTDNIKTDLYVKDIDDSSGETQGKIDKKEKDQNIIETNDKDNKPNQNTKNHDLEMKVLKCELNNAMNTLIKEVSSDSESNENNIEENQNQRDQFARQDSSSSVSSSQCTAKYNPNYSSLNDVSNILHEELRDKNIYHTPKPDVTTSHVNDVITHVTGTSTKTKSSPFTKQPLALKDICVKRITSLPYGDKIIEELAAVSERLQNITIINAFCNNSPSVESTVKMPYYPLPDISAIESISLETKPKDHVPPPVLPRNSSLKKSHDEHWTGLPTKSEPVYVCLSPSQKMLMEKTNTVITKEDATRLVDMHKKFVDRRGYNEYYNKEKKRDKNIDNTPIVPFKSKTGSRLLALIRDPSVTNVKNSSTPSHLNQSLDHLEKTCSRIERMSKKFEQFSSNKELTHSFRPIPPPRPKKYSSSYYESDDSDFTDSSLRSIKSERKYFHYSTGALNKEIESDVSNIQNMHRFYTNMRDQYSQNPPRRPSLPKDLCEQQMEYIRQKEKEVETEIRRLEQLKSNAMPTEKRGPRPPLIYEKDITEENIIEKNNRKKDVTYISQIPENGDKSKLSSVFSSSQEEIQRDKMYSEYMNQMAERHERKQQKVIKITTGSKSASKSASALDTIDSKVNNKIEEEFICKARERWDKLGIKDPETEDEKENSKDVYTEPKVIEHKIKVIEGGEEKDVKRLPSHLQDFVRFTAKDKQQGEGGESPAASPHVLLLCVIIIMIAISKQFWRLLRNKD